MGAILNTSLATLYPEGKDDWRMDHVRTNFPTLDCLIDNWQSMGRQAMADGFYCTSAADGHTKIYRMDRYTSIRVNAFVGANELDHMVWAGEHGSTQLPGALVKQIGAGWTDKGARHEVDPDHVFDEHQVQLYQADRKRYNADKRNSNKDRPLKLRATKMTDLDNVVARPYYYVKSVARHEISLPRAMQLTTTSRLTNNAVAKINLQNNKVVQSLKSYLETREPYEGRDLDSYRYGHKVEINGHEVMEYEFDARDPRSLLSAMFQRQFKPTCRPCVYFRQAFQDSFMNEYLEKWTQHINRFCDELEDGKLPVFDPHAWASKYPKGKKERYLECMRTQSLNPSSIGRGAVSYIVKTGEVWTMDQPQLDTNGLLVGVKERARLIAPGDDTFVGWYVYTMGIISEAMKAFEPAYRIGDSLPQLTEVLRR